MLAKYQASTLGLTLALYRVRNRRWPAHNSPENGLVTGLSMVILSLVKLINFPT